MCGIVGFKALANAYDLENAIRSMCDALAYRGPDDAGQWIDAPQGMALGHRRLSIVDLSPAGHQPMESASGRYIITLNGEIYNYAAIRQQLEASGWKNPWRGHSDTEVLLAAIEQWGIEKTIEQLVGMFAFALWDRRELSLTLVRDRLGEKPLYYGWLGDTFAFASEVAALERHPSWRGEIDRDALTLLMRHNCIPAPYSIYRGVHKLRPGHMLTLKQKQREPAIICYWDAAAVTLSSQRASFTGSREEAVDRLDVLLRQSLSGQMQADVPVGAFLSGGVDSSAVVAVMQTMSAQPVRSFSIGFRESDYNEATYAKAVAQHLGTSHTELYVTPDDVMRVIPKLPGIYSEPFADASQIPTFLVSQLARRSVTVSLSGDGGDELFSGYNRYRLAGVWGKATSVTRGMRTTLASALTSIRPDQWDKMATWMQSLLPGHKRQQRVGDKLHKFAGVFSAQDTEELYRRLTSHVTDPEHLVLGAVEPPTLLTGLIELPTLPEPARQMMLYDLMTYLPDDILVKLDRASMAVSLESRVPLLDHRIVAFAASLPLSWLRHQGMSKWPLRQLLYRYVPRRLIDRPKTGFGIPLDHWLRGPLKPWAEDLLSSASLRAQGYFDAAYVQCLWDEHQSGHRNWQYQLWNILMFQAWFMSRTPQPHINHT